MPSRLTPHSRRSPLASQRGTVLLVAMVFAIVIAIALTSYLKMASTTMTVSQRSFLANDAMNVNEAALEQTLWSFNRSSDQTNAGQSITAWSNWTTSGNNAWRSFTGYTLAQNATGYARVFVQQYNSPGIPVPTAVCESVITPAQGQSITKMVMVTLARRSFFSTGMVAKNGITFSGNNASVDSWNSNPNNASPSPNYAYNSTNAPRHSYGSIATTSVNASINVQNADIYGYVSVGSNSTSAISLGTQGLVGDFTQTAGTMDTSRVTTNFTEDLPNVSVPAAATSAATLYNESGSHGGTNALTGAANEHLPVLTGQNRSTAVTINNVPTYVYQVQYIDLTGNASNQLTIDSAPSGSAAYNVMIIVTAGAGTDAVKTAGSAGIVIGSGSTLSIYTAGNVNVTGNSTSGSGGGVTNNSGNPTGFQIWGTATTAGAQTIEVAGNGALSSIVYAPNATVKIDGNGDMYGAVVGNTVQVTGNAAFHYDESLASYGGSNPFKVSKWIEVRSASDRTTWINTVNAAVGSTYF